jgi:hypothetical protein
MRASMPAAYHHDHDHNRDHGAEQGALDPEEYAASREPARRLRAGGRAHIS